MEEPEEKDRMKDGDCEQEKEGEIEGERETERSGQMLWF